MKRTPLLRREHLVVPLEHDSLVNAIAGLIGALVGAGSITDRALLSGAIEGDPRKIAVSISPDVILPHYRTDAVTEPTLALGVTTEPLAGTESEGTGPRVVALVLAPAEATSIYLRTVSGLARVLHERSVMERLLAARSPADVLAIKELAALHIEPGVLASDIMIATATAQPDDTLREAVEIMIASDTRGLPVVGDKGEILGLVTEADVLRGLHKSGTRASEEKPSLVPPLRVRDVMVRSIMCIPDGADLDDVVNLLISKETELFPVVAEGRLIGMVRRVDILRELYGR